VTAKTSIAEVPFIDRQLLEEFKLDAKTGLSVNLDIHRHKSATEKGQRSSTSIEFEIGFAEYTGKKVMDVKNPTYLAVAESGGNTGMPASNSVLG